MPLINRIVATQNIDIAQKELADHLTDLTPELQNIIIQQILETELAQAWDKKEIKDRLNKFFILYLPRLARKQQLEYLRQLDYKVVSIIEKPWKVSPTFLVKLFYDGQDKEELLKTLRTYKHFWSRELDLTDAQKKVIEALEKKILSHRQEFKYRILNKELPIDGKFLLLDSKIFNPILEPNKFNFPPLNDRRLTQLSLTNNGISDIKKGAFNGLDMLEVLRLSANHLTELEIGTFENLNNLTSLSLSNNKLTSITPGVFKGLNNLESLDLSSNQLADIFDVTVFDDLPNLRILDISENKFSNDKISEINKKLPNITIAF
jgi:Leucine-rich repeat (LRR) protein